MKIIAIIARYLLGLMFTVFGLNGFLHFLPQPHQSNPLAIQFFVAVSKSHYSDVFYFTQLIAGILLLSGYFVPLGLILLAAELVNILTFHATMDHSGWGPALLGLVLWLIVAYQYRSSFAAVLSPKSDTSGRETNL